jgi:hypothetical protein
MADQTAPAAQATTAATAPTTESAPIAAISPDAAAAAKDGVASSRLLVHQQQPPRLRARPDGLARAAEAMKAQLAAKAAEAPKVEPAKVEAAKDTPTAPASDAAKTESTPAEPAKEAAKEPTKEPPKADPKVEEKQQRLSRGLAIIAEREEKVRVREKSIQAQLAQLEAKTKAATEDPDVKFTKTLKEALAKGGKAAVLQALGIDLRSGIEELSRQYQDPTPEDIARKVAQEELEKHTKTLAEQAASEKAAAMELEKARVQVARQEFGSKIETAFAAASDDFPCIVARKITPDQVVNFAAYLERENGGKTPTAAEALKELEKRLDAEYEDVAKRKAAKTKAAEPVKVEPAKPLTAPAATETAAKPAAKPAEQRSRERGPVAPDPNRRPKGAKISALDRAALAMKNLGIS